MLELTNVRKRFNLEAGFFARESRHVYAVNGVSLEIRGNETYGLVGESGCGKTTLARLIVGMYPLSGGGIVYTGREGRRYSLGNLDRSGLRRLRSRIKYIFQDPARSLNPRLTVLGVLTSGYRWSPSWPGRKQARREAEAILEDVGLSGADLHRRPGEFSGGQRQRIAIARALIQKPELLICDEVVSALDVSIQSQILSLLQRLKEEHRLSQLFIAHDLAVVSYLSDRVGVMYGGRLVEEAPAGELVGNRVHPYTRHLYASIPDLSKAGSRVGRGRGPSAGGPGGRTDAGPWPRGGEAPALAAAFEEREPAACPVHGRDCPEERAGLRRIGTDHYVACSAEKQAAAGP